MTDKPRFANVSFASDLIRFPSLNARDLERTMETVGGGILVGRMRGLPYFLDFDGAINPHVFVCGITGSGKTYLMRNLMMKLVKISGFVVALVDFTGEYESFVELAGGEKADAADFAELLSKKTSGIFYLNLRNCRNQKARVEIADGILNKIIENMRTRDTRGGRVFIMLDEAWKLLGSSKSLQTLLREGRKYGYGLIFSSQLVEDMDLAMLSNAATLFVFRLQNKQGLRKLAGNYGLSGEQVEMIQRLGVGSCVAMQSLVSGKREFCLIEKVHGIEFEEMVNLKIGDKTRLEITKGKFEEAIRGVCGKDTVSEALRAGERNGYIDLAAMIAFLLDGGVRGKKLLKALRKLGIDEDALADSFAVAVSSRESE